jgi:hypothetical protein
MNDLPDALAQLTERLEILERRVDALEHPGPVEQPPALPSPGAPLASDPGEGLSFAQTGGAFSTLGKAMLGIAGAYLLRAVAEASVLPRPVVAAIAIVYALLWLLAAARAADGAWFGSTIYAGTSALILAPMLWELTLSFKVLPPAATAAVLGGFAAAAAVLAWQRNLASVFWVANATAALVAVILSIATRQLEPFIAVLLLMVLICEIAAAFDRAHGVRSLVAAAADVAIWGLIFIYSGPRDARSDYPMLGIAALVAPGLTLFVIDAAGVAFRTTVLNRKITIFETVQTMIALLLAASGLLYFALGGVAVAGVLFVVLSGASYGAAFVFFDGAAEARNSSVFLAWSASLFLAGCLLGLPALGASLCLAVAALGAMLLGVRFRRGTLQFHGLVYLAGAAAASGLLGYAFHAFAGILPGPPSWTMGLVSVCAVLCFGIQKPLPAEPWQRHFLHLAVAALAVGAVAALLVEGLAALTALAVHPGPQHIAFVRTLVLCAAALGLAFGGSHWRRNELMQLSYAALALLAVKLLLEDLRHGHLEFIAASIFLFAVTLIAVPRIARMGQRWKDAPAQR